MSSAFQKYGAITGLFLFQAALIALYIASEHTLYTWDFSMYISGARMFYENYSHGGDITGILSQSMSSNYPILYAVPSLLTFDLFGESRTTFILTNFFFFAIPTEIVVAAILHRGLSLPWQRAYMITLIGLLCIPPFWTPLLQGYPDHGAAFLLALAFYLTLTNSRSLWQSILLGVVIAACPIFRRHYAYGALALMSISVCFDLIKARQSLPDLLKCIFSYIVTGLSAVIFLVLAAPDFFHNALTTDYTALYASYKAAPFAFPLFALSAFGFILLVASAYGYAKILRTNEAAQRLLSWSLLWLLIWSFGPAELGPHYVLQLLPLVILCGIASIFHEPLKQGRLSQFILAFLTLNAIASFVLLPNANKPNNYGLPGVFSESQAPVQRHDLQDLAKLASHLSTVGKTQDRELILGSSYTFNQDVLRAVNTDILLNADDAFRRLQSPEIDGVQQPPYDVFPSASIYVVPTPFQYHLDPKGQKVVTAAASFFPPSPELMSLFEKEASPFTIDNRIMISIWKRTRDWTPRELHFLNEQISEQTKTPPRSWLTTTAPMSINSGYQNNQEIFQGTFLPAYPTWTLAQDKPLTGKHILFDGMMRTTPTCLDFIFSFSLTDESGKEIAHSAQSVDASTQHLHYELTPPKTPAFLRVTLSQKERNQNFCIVLLSNLVTNGNTAP